MKTPGYRIFVILVVISICTLPALLRSFGHLASGQDKPSDRNIGMQSSIDEHGNRGSQSRPAAGQAAEARARETESKMTDDERFSLIISMIGPAAAVGLPRDKRIPENVKNTSAGYTPGIKRLGVP